MEEPRVGKPVLLITSRLPDAVEARAGRDYDVRANPGEVPPAGAEIVRLAQGAAAILCCPADRLDGAVVAGLPDSVRVIATFSVGHEHVDLAAAAARGIAVCNTPDVLSVATAEIAMLLMLAAARRAGEGERMVRAGAWAGWTPTQLLGRQLSGRRLGILGMGRIGREVARMAQGFAMPVHYRNRSRLAPALEQGATYHATDERFLAQCDVLSISAPGGEGTHHWLDGARIRLLPRGAIVVNVARGSLVDDSALIEALRSGAVGAAGLDVYEREPDLDPRYATLENVVLLPHLGSATVETRNAMGFLALDGIDAVLEGRTPASRIA